MRAIWICVGGIIAASTAVPANAQQATGVYIGAGAGVNILQDQDSAKTESVGLEFDSELRYDIGPAGNVYIGYDWGSIRADAEISLRTNNLDRYSIGDFGIQAKEGHQRTIGILGNVYYDFDFGSPFVPYIGAGAGVALIQLHVRTLDEIGGQNFQDFDTQLAYQGIAGVSYGFSPNLSANLEYRYLGTTEAKFTDDIGGFETKIKTGSNNNHTILAGVRYTFAPAPAVPAVVETVSPRSYLVFFDFDSSRLTPEARHIVAWAAAEALQGNSTRIDVTGHTDRSGSVRYNQALSVRRGESVRRELVADGVSDNLIVVRGVGESDPLVPTADGVREPQNRRVEIVLN